MKKYSVLLLYPDYIAEEYGKETFYAFVEAESSLAAIKAAQQMAADANEVYFEEDTEGNNDPADFSALLCIEGHHYGLEIE